MKKFLLVLSLVSVTGLVAAQPTTKPSRFSGVTGFVGSAYASAKSTVYNGTNYAKTQLQNHPYVVAGVTAAVVAAIAYKYMVSHKKKTVKRAAF